MKLKVTPTVNRTHQWNVYATGKQLFEIGKPRTVFITITTRSLKIFNQLSNSSRLRVVADRRSLTPWGACGCAACWNGPAGLLGMEGTRASSLCFGRGMAVEMGEARDCFLFNQENSKPQICRGFPCLQDIPEWRLMVFCSDPTNSQGSALPGLSRHDMPLRKICQRQFLADLQENAGQSLTV